MAQTGYTPIILFNSTTASNVPTTSNLAVGELAINIPDGKLFYNKSGTITVLATSASASIAVPITTVNGGTGVVNGSNNTITFTGNYTLGLTLTGNTAVTFPTSGTLLSTATVVTTAQGGTGSSTLTFPSGTVSIGYLNIPQNSQSTAYTTVASDAGKCIFHPSSDANARTFTIDSNANVPYALGTVIQFINMTSQAVTIAIASDTLTWAQGGGSGNRTLAQYGVANCTKIGTTQWLLTGTNVT